GEPFTTPRMRRNRRDGRIGCESFWESPIHTESWPFWASDFPMKSRNQKKCTRWNGCSTGKDTESKILAEASTGFGCRRKAPSGLKPAGGNIKPPRSGGGVFFVPDHPKKPSCLFASSDILSGDQGGFQTMSTLTERIPGCPSSSRSTALAMVSCNGHPGVVSVMRI